MSKNREEFLTKYGYGSSEKGWTKDGKTFFTEEEAYEFVMQELEHLLMPAMLMGLGVNPPTIKKLILSNTWPARQENHEAILGEDE